MLANVIPFPLSADAHSGFLLFLSLWFLIICVFVEPFLLCVAPLFLFAFVWALFAHVYLHDYVRICIV